MELPIKKVILKDGQEAVINAEDFDPNLHTEIGASPAAEDTTALSVKDAARIITETTDPVVLDELEAAEEGGKRRKGVLEAIEARREELEE